MRCVSIAVLFTISSAVVAAEKPEDQAKDAAIAFLKAVKAKDVDAIMKLSDVPFAYREAGSLAMHKESDALKKWVNERLEEIKDTSKVPVTIDEFRSFSMLKYMIKDANDRTLAEEVMGKDGFLAITMTEDNKKVGIAVRIKDGKAKVVGLIR